MDTILDFTCKLYRQTGPNPLNTDRQKTKKLSHPLKQNVYSETFPSPHGELVKERGLLPLRGAPGYKNLFPSPHGELVKERLTLQPLTLKDFQKPNRHTKIFAVNKGGAYAISTQPNSLKALQIDESTHLNQKMRVPALRRGASIYKSVGRKQPKDLKKRHIQFSRFFSGSTNSPTVRTTLHNAKLPCQAEKTNLL